MPRCSRRDCWRPKARSPSRGGARAIRCRRWRARSWNSSTTPARRRLCDELRDGADYRVVMTTPGGLYRYDLGDRLRCHGHVDGAAAAGIRRPRRRRDRHRGREAERGLRQRRRSAASAPARASRRARRRRRSMSCWSTRRRARTSRRRRRWSRSACAPIRNTPMRARSASSARSRRARSTACSTATRACRRGAAAGSPTSSRRS